MCVTSGPVDTRMRIHRSVTSWEVGYPVPLFLNEKRSRHVSTRGHFFPRATRAPSWQREMLVYSVVNPII